MIIDDGAEEGQGQGLHIGKTTYTDTYVYMT